MREKTLADAWESLCVHLAQRDAFKGRDMSEVERTLYRTLFYSGATAVIALANESASKGVLAEMLLKWAELDAELIEFGKEARAIAARGFPGD